MVQRVLPLLVLALFVQTACDQAPKLESSGNADVDQTASFLAYVIEEQRTNNRFENSTELSMWLSSAIGKAEWVPPSIEYEEDAAEVYNGPRPAETVGVWDEPWETESFKYYILVSAEPTKDVVVLRAFNMGESEPFYVWKI